MLRPRWRGGSLRDAEEIERLKARLDAHLVHGDYRRLVTTVFEFATPPPLCASFVFCPKIDFEGNHLQDVSDLKNDLSWVTVTLLSTSSGGFLFVSHEDTATGAPTRFLESLKAQDDLSSSVVWLIACESDNFAISPDWYEGLTPDQAGAFIRGFQGNADPFVPSSCSLCARETDVPDWTLRNIFTL